MEVILAPKALFDLSVTFSEGTTVNKNTKYPSTSEKAKNSRHGYSVLLQLHIETLSLNKRQCRCGRDVECET